MGTRLATAEMFNSGEDHPHACGDKAEVAKFLKSAYGSSPRVWGQERDGQCRDTRRGIIPTRVGTSHYVTIGFGGERDHPHACGDKLRSPHRDNAV